MSDPQQDPTLQLAAWLEHRGWREMDEAAAQLRKLHSLNQELLAALKACVTEGNRWHPCAPVVMQAKAAIIKAEAEEAK